MITRNFENFLRTVLLSTWVSNDIYKNYSVLQIINVNGLPVFLNNSVGSSSFPYSVKATPTLYKNNAGISVGSDGTAPTKFDYNLKSTISSGISISLSSAKSYYDEPGNNYMTLLLTVTNTSSSEVTIREIGYKQDISCNRMIASNKSYNNNTYVNVVLFDRTVLDTPLTIQAGDSGVIYYKLETICNIRTKNGIKLVPFGLGSEEDIIAMIDGARNGLIDLQTDGGWHIGDVRTIHINSWVGYNNTQHPEQDIAIVLTQFGDYNNCGCMFQFDFFNCVVNQSYGPRNNSSMFYGTSKMYTDTIPALFEAFPSWLKTRMKTFDCYAINKVTNQVELVQENKLALRAEVEVNGTQSYGTGEGSFVDYYKMGSGNKEKTGNDYNTSTYWLRTPSNSSSQQGIASSIITSAYVDYDYGVAVFGCI
jgi:hypothetical protein